MMSARQSLRTVPSGGWTPARERLAALGLATAASLSGAALAVLAATGLWYVALALLLALPAFVVIHRKPLATLALWLAVAPLVDTTDSGAIRRVFWLVHRLLPLATLAAIALGARFGLRSRPLPRLGWPEALMGLYVAASLTSILLTATATLATVYTLYDRVVVPMCLYLVLRLLEPSEQELRRLLPLVAFLLLSQSLIGVVSWVAPDGLPTAWMGKGGERTTGSLRAPEVFGTTAMLCGLLLLHRGLSASSALRRLLGMVYFVLAAFMTFMTFSRGTWLAAFIAIVGVVVIYRRAAALMLLIAAPIFVIVYASGLLAEQAEFAQHRLQSRQAEESALSRLPVVQASVDMFAARPLTGWGYEQFDQHSRQFQRRVGNIYVPTKEHSSHNLFLTTLAEQGIVGFVLLFGPLLYWLARYRRVRPLLPRGGLMGANFVAVLWLALAGFVVVNNTYRMQTQFALGIVWFTLGLLATSIARHRPPASTDHAFVDAMRVARGVPGPGGRG